MSPPSHDRQIRAGEDLRAEIAAWVWSSPLNNLVSRFGGNPEVIRGDGEIGQWLAGLDAFSDRWDSRGGRERNLAVSVDLSAEDQTAVLRAAEELGLCDSAPPSRRSFDHMLMLGGLVRACFGPP